MKDRIKEIRKEMNITQQEFADSLNISKSSVEAFEYGRRELTDRTISDICRIYNVNEEWLRNGFGEMHGPIKKAQLISQLMKDLTYIHEDSILYDLVEAAVNMTDNDIEMLYSYALFLKQENEKKQTTKK